MARPKPAVAERWRASLGVLDDRWTPYCVGRPVGWMRLSGECDEELHCRGGVG